MSWGQLIAANRELTEMACEDERVRKVATTVGPSAIGALAGAVGGPAVGKVASSATKAVVAADEDLAAKLIVATGTAVAVTVGVIVLPPIFIVREIWKALFGDD